MSVKKEDLQPGAVIKYLAGERESMPPQPIYAAAVVIGTMGIPMQGSSPEVVRVLVAGTHAFRAESAFGQRFLTYRGPIIFLGDVIEVLVPSPEIPRV